MQMNIQFNSPLIALNLVNGDQIRKDNRSYYVPQITLVVIKKIFLREERTVDTSLSQFLIGSLWKFLELKCNPTNEKSVT